MKNKKTLYVIGIALLLSTLLLFVPVQPAKAQFVLAYDFSPDNNGNAIALLRAYFDGDYNGTMYADPDSYPTITTTATLEVIEGTSISLQIGCWLNSTYADVGSLEEGRTVIRHNVSVLATNGTEIFSQQNGTYYSSTDFLDPMYYYEYDMLLDFVPVSGQVYTVIVIYEVFGA